MKDIIIQTVAQNGEVTLTVKSSADYGDNVIATFASTGFLGWIMRKNGTSTIINNAAPAKVLDKVYKLIVW